jgi:hypothetical protein
MSSPEERERRLNILGCSFGRDLDVEIRREKTNLRNSLAQDFEREMVLTEVCVGRNGFSGALYHRMMTDMTHRILKELEMVRNNPADFEVDLLAMGINSDGSAIKCLMDVNRAEANCEEFRVPGDRINGAFKVFIEFESGAKDRAAQNSYLKSLKDDINDIDFIEDNVENADLGVDLAAIGINPGGQGLECIINLDNEKAECEEFKVPSDKISGQITEIVEFD